VTEAELKELLELARKAATGDAQVAELLQKLAARCHQLDANAAKLQATCDRLTRHIGALFDESALLKLELGGDVTAQVRAAAYRVVQAELDAHSIVGVGGIPLMAAADAAKAGA
jgi:prefoldin subunit 5